SRVGCNEKRGMIAAPHCALEAARNFDAEQHLARQQEIVEFLDVVNLAGEAEIGGIFQRFQDGAPEIGVFLQEHRGRQVTRRRVDGKAEQQKLHHRDHHDHGERNAVTLELDELLYQHREGAPPESEAGFADLAATGRGELNGHWKLSLDRDINSMKTSSSDGSVFCQRRPGRSRQDAMAASRAALSRPETCSELPNGATMSIPGRPASCSI